MSTEPQPSLETLVKLYVTCKDTAGTDAFCGNLTALTKARELKHTWVGSEENAFRFVLNAYLSGE